MGHLRRRIVAERPPQDDAANVRERARHSHNALQPLPCLRVIGALRKQHAVEVVDVTAGLHQHRGDGVVAKFNGDHQWAATQVRRVVMFV